MRTTALSFASAAARVGSILSPLIGGLDVISPAVPIAVYGLVVLASGLQSVIIWPETTGIKISDTVEEAERLANQQNQWYKGNCCFLCTCGSNSTSDREVKVEPETKGSKA